MAAGVPSVGPPLFRVGQCATLREAGRRHGHLAAQHIRTVMDSEEISLARAFVAEGAGAAALFDLRADNASAFPTYAEEIEGIAEGSGVDVMDIWLVNLLAEVEGLMGLPPEKRIERCSDVMLRGEAGALWHGHNEDWTTDRRWHDSFYFVAYDATPAADFVPVMGMCYPGMIPGFAMTWANNGLLLTQNSLFPPDARRRGLGCIFVARRALEEGTMDLAIERLVRPGQALGCNVNLVALPRQGGTPRACSVEVYGPGDVAAVCWLGQDSGSSLMHFNVYSSLPVGNANNPRNSASRKRRTIKLLRGAPRSRTSGAHDVTVVLADTEASRFPIHPIYGPTTMASWLLDTKAMTVVVWAPPGRPGHTKPLYQWDIDSFFACAYPDADRCESGCPSSLARVTLGIESFQDPCQSRGMEPLHPVLWGVHRTDLLLRREVNAALCDVTRGRADDPKAVVTELNALRRQLLKRARAGEIDAGTAVELFRARLWGGRQHGGEPPQRSVESTPASSAVAAEALSNSRVTVSPLNATLRGALAETCGLLLLLFGVLVIVFLHASAAVASFKALVALLMVLACFRAFAVALSDRGMANILDLLREWRRYAEKSCARDGTAPLLPLVASPVRNSWSRAS